MGNNTEEIGRLTNDETVKIEKFIEENMNKGNILGISVTIVKDDKTVYQKGFGYADIEAQNAVDSKSFFEIGSNSKAFAALGILSLEESGQKLDRKVVLKYRNFSTTKLSRGQKKRLALLITCLEDRPIYLFDEWAADQDLEFRMFFYNTLLPRLKEKEKCVIAITHDDHYFNLADKIIKMGMGISK